jgi:ketosteroid isomerase-like protein
VHAEPEHVRRVDAMGSAVHSVLERVEMNTPEGPASSYVTATNVYHRTAHGWRMVIHHASPGADGEPQEIRQSPQVLH